jgi:hypothetical protein
VGFWREHSGDSFPSIFDARRQKLDPDQLKRVEIYLTQNPICVASPGFVNSAFNSRKIAGTSSLMTDGVWIWHGTLAFYVIEHDLALPLNFLEYMRHKRYVPANEEEINLREINFPW